MAASEPSGIAARIRSIIGSVRAALKARPKRGRLARLTAAPIPVVYQGTAYDYAPLQLVDYGSLAEFMRKMIYRQAGELVAAIQAAGGPLEHVEKTWDEAREAVRDPLSTDFIWHPDAVAESVYLALRHRTPTMTRVLARQIVNDPDACQRVVEAMMEIRSADGTLKNS